ncbi:MAG: sugar nucleotide-binding protein [Caldilineaceae bacterium]
MFPGLSGHHYREYDQPGPQSVYARSKLAGETAARQVLDRLFVVRTAWLFGPGGANFPRKIIAAADKHGQLRVVADEVGNPSYAPDVATAIVQLLATNYYGIYHLVNSGQASRFDFAQAALAATGRSHIPLTPISHADWPRPAPPPLHAVLVNQAAAALGIELRPWSEALQAYVAAETGHLVQ